jgi:hypothetical protein
MNVYLVRNTHEASRLARAYGGRVVCVYRPYRWHWVSEGFSDGDCRCVYAGARRPREAIERARRYLQQG